MFADDLMFYCHGDIQSLYIITKLITTFSELSGLFPNLSKSLLFIANVPEDTQQLMINLCGSEFGNLPIRYLGMPLSSMRHNVNDCRILVERVTVRITCWTARFLSYTGVNLRTSGAQVAWWNVCKPKDFGGVGIPQLAALNRISMLRHIRNLFKDRDQSIWFEWAHKNLIKNRSPLDTRIDHNLIAYSQWEDWAKVQCFIRHDQWRIPRLFREIIPFIGTTKQLPMLIAGSHDSVTWILSSIGSFHLATTYKALISSSPSILWHSSIWFSNHIPRYSFIARVTFSHNLKTRDSPALAKKIAPNYCSLCLAAAESHHLFFKCIKAPDGYVYKLCLTIFVYFIWRERNRRNAMNPVASTASIIKLIYTNVRNRLMSCKLRDSKAARTIAAAWSLPSSVFGEGQ
ncbi:uncharacterized protein LOC132309953 [Cornus florida]|uniref:uncharacterized protein LOC132309953 n=1 Tax=Cornus florida TaxID=4283 RepID=UPI0028968399|nr:uncharacterized protein LOC132309953 [Cornus florida]